MPGSGVNAESNTAFSQPYDSLGQKPRKTNKNQGSSLSDTQVASGQKRLQQVQTSNQPSKAASRIHRIPRPQSNVAPSQYSDPSRVTQRSSSVARMPGSSGNPAAASRRSDNQLSSSQGPQGTSGQKRMQEVNDGTSSKRLRVASSLDDAGSSNRHTAPSERSDLSGATHRTSAVARMPGPSNKPQSNIATGQNSDLLSGRIPQKKDKNQLSSSQGPQGTSGQKRMQEVNHGTSSKRQRAQPIHEDARNINQKRRRLEVNSNLGKSKKNHKRITPKIQANRKMILEVAATIEAKFKGLSYDQWLSQMLKTEKGLINSATFKFKQLFIPSYIRTKLEAETGFRGQIPWDKVRKFGITGWPAHIPIKRVDQVGKGLNSIIESLDEIEFKDQFLEAVKNAEVRQPWDRKRREVNVHFAKMYPGFLTQKGVPWRKINRKDVIGWPEGVDFKNPKDIKKSDGFDKVYEAYKEMRFTDEFLKKFKESHFTNRAEGRRKNNYVTWSETTDISKVLRQQWNEQVGKTFAKMPWKGITKDDLIGWPENIDVQNPAKWSAEDRRSLLQVVDSIKFTDAYVERIKREELSKSRTREISQIEKKISDHIRSLLNNILEHTNHKANNVPWDKIKHEDLNGWPTDLEISLRLNREELLRISSNLKQMTFTDDFKKRYIDYLDYRRTLT